MAALALEIEHGVDHMLDHAGPGDLALLGDMADKHDDVPGYVWQSASCYACHPTGQK